MVDVGVSQLMAVGCFEDGKVTQPLGSFGETIDVDCAAVGACSNVLANGSLAVNGSNSVGGCKESKPRDQRADPVVEFNRRTQAVAEFVSVDDERQTLLDVIECW